MDDLTTEDIRIGRVPMQLWHFLGLMYVVPNIVTPATLLGIRRTSADAKSKKLTMDHAISVLEASKAINRMMGRNEFFGLPGVEK